MERKYSTAEIIAEGLIKLTDNYCVVGSPYFCTQSEFENTNKRFWAWARIRGLEAEVAGIIDEHFQNLMASAIADIEFPQQFKEVANGPKDSESKEQS